MLGDSSGLNLTVGPRTSLDADPLFVHHLSLPPQALGAKCSGEPSPLLPGDLCLHRGGGEAAGSSTHPQQREAAGAHPGTVSGPRTFSVPFRVLTLACGWTHTFVSAASKRKTGLFAGGLARACAPFPSRSGRHSSLDHCVGRAGLKMRSFQLCS